MQTSYYSARSHWDRHELIGLGLVVALAAAVVVLCWFYLGGGRGGNFPASGTVTVSGSVVPGKVSSRLAISAGGQNVVVQLFDGRMRHHVMSIYVRANEHVIAPVPVGTYRLRLVKGDRWQGFADLFGPSSRYSVMNDVLEFSGSEGHDISVVPRGKGQFSMRPLLRAGPFSRR